MASKLEESTKTAKKLAIGCGIIILIILLYNLVVRVFKKPPPPLDPYPRVADQVFGELPKIEFESLPLPETSKPRYQIETTDGKLPTLPTIVNVYKTSVPRQSLTAQDDAIKIAKSLKFLSDPQNISATELKWTNGAKTLIINKLYGDVTLTTNYEKDPDAKSEREILPDPEPYIRAAKTYLKNAYIFPIGYEESNKSSITYLKLNTNHSFEKAKSAQDANFVRVDFFKRIESVGVIIPDDVSEEQMIEIESYRIYTEVLTDNPYEGLIYIILGNTSGTHNIFEIKFIDWKLESKSTYTLIPLEDAWDKVQNNEGYLRSLFEINENPFKEYIPLNVQTFLLTDVEIVYYSSRDYLKYIQPLYKFTGIAKLEEDNEVDSDFTFYYPVIP